MASLSQTARGNPVTVDFFSGPGGLSLGFQQAGFTIGMGVESDHFSAATYLENFPSALVLEDEVGKVSVSDTLSVLDKKFPRRSALVLVAGPPCQPFSNANMHPSYSSVELFVKLLEGISPDAFLFENVTSFATLDAGKCMTAFIARIRKLGYSPQITQLEAHNFGVPQHRRRLFIGGLRGSLSFRMPAPHQTIRVHNWSGKNDGGFCVRDAISDLPQLPSGGGGADSGGYGTRNQDLCVYQRRARQHGARLFNHWSSEHSKPVLETISRIPPGLSLLKIWDELPLRIRKRYANKENIQFNIYRRLSWQGISPTIVHPRRAMLLHPRQTRILSVREAARIQGFPDSFRFKGGIDSQYQQVANAVPPPMAKGLAKIYRNNLNGMF